MRVCDRAGHQMVVPVMTASGSSADGEAARRVEEDGGVLVVAAPAAGAGEGIAVGGRGSGESGDRSALSGQARCGPAVAHPLRRAGRCRTYRLRYAPLCLSRVADEKMPPKGNHSGRLRVFRLPGPVIMGRRWRGARLPL